MSGCTESANDLCMQCALCCDGTIYDTVRIKDEDRTHLARNNITIEMTEEQEHIHQPCQGLCGKTCSIYATRPRTCRNFKCFVLERLENGSITFDRAKSLVELALRAVADVEAYALPGENRVAQRRRWRETRDDWRDNPDFYLKMMALYVVIDREFRKEGKRMLEFKTA